MSKLYPILIILCCIFFTYATPLYGFDSHKLQSYDSLSRVKLSEAKVNVWYDSLATFSSKNKYSKLLYDSFFIANKPEVYSSEVLDESAEYKQFEGKKVGNISVERYNIYDGDGKNTLQRVANKTHALTREKVIRNDIMIKSGDEINAELTVVNKHLLISRKYIYDVDFIYTQSLVDSTILDLLVVTRDSWTISIDGSVSLSGNAMLELYDRNYLGLGHGLSVKTNFDWKDIDYGGSEIEYDIYNIWGSFFAFNAFAGKDFDDTGGGFSVEKDFLKPTDYAGGGRIAYYKTPYEDVYLDSTFTSSWINVDVWGGRSRESDFWNSNLFLTARYITNYYIDRPFVEAEFNSKFHDHTTIIAGIGLYKEHFYSSNLIYSFGVKEYLSSGFNVELIGGYNWTEFGDEMIFGLNMKKGILSDIGYFAGSIGARLNVGTLENDLTQSILDIKMKYISNLYGSGFSRYRYFLDLNYTRGWSISDPNELLEFTDSNAPRIYNSDVYGSSRLVLNSELAYFTKQTPLGCRMVVYGFLDVATIGNGKNPFMNPFYSTVGIGLRLKNDKLVFGAIQFRLGFAVGRSGWSDSELFEFESVSMVDRIRYTPDRPGVLPFE